MWYETLTHDPAVSVNLLNLRVKRTWRVAEELPYWEVDRGVGRQGPARVAPPDVSPANGNLSLVLAGRER